MGTIAFSDAYKEDVGKLRCFRGLDTHSAMVLLAETGDFSRFGSPRQLMAYWGLVPGEHSSGDSIRHGPITKAGNRRCRRILVEAAWHYRHRPALGKALSQRQQGQPPGVVAHTWKAQHRLHKKYSRIAHRKEKQKAIFAPGDVCACTLPSTTNAPDRSSPTRTTPTLVHLDCMASTSLPVPAERKPRGPVCGSRI